MTPLMETYAGQVRSHLWMATTFRSLSKRHADPWYTRQIERHLELARWFLHQLRKEEGRG